MFGLDVAEERWRLREFGVALLTSVWTISVVSSPVGDQVRTVGEYFAAILAAVSLHSDVNRFDVTVEVGLLVEGFVVAQPTNVTLDRFVRFGVISQLLGRPKGSLAEIARVVAFLRVSLPVSMQIAGSPEQLATDFALILAFIVVNSHVKL